MSVEVLFLAAAIGAVAGSRSMLAPAAVAWAAFLGRVEPGSGWLAVFSHPLARWIWTALALGELVADLLPFVPSRRKPGPFAVRIVSGGLSGAAIGATHGLLALGAVAGALGAVAGTLGGHALRARMAAAFGSDPPAALAEDAIAIALAVAVVWMWR
jgi:uncharacterized membrane protein